MMFSQVVRGNHAVTAFDHPCRLDLVSNTTKHLVCCVQSLVHLIEPKFLALKWLVLVLVVVLIHRLVCIAPVITL